MVTLFVAIEMPLLFDNEDKGTWSVHTQYLTLSYLVSLSNCVFVFQKLLTSSYCHNDSWPSLPFCYMNMAMSVDTVRDVQMCDNILVHSYTHSANRINCKHVRKCVAPFSLVRNK